MKRVLMIAYHFPPIAGSSGVQRTLQFARHLPAHGWQPIVLSISPRAYERTSDDLLDSLPEGLVVERAFGLDAARHLSVRGRYPGWLARPDRWASWIPFAVHAGRRLIRSHRPAAIWSTFPIASAHHIGLHLQRASGLPWIADFRDPMAQSDYPRDPAQRKRLAAFETRIADVASATVFTSPGARRRFCERHALAAGRSHLIENGYDEDAFPKPGEYDASPLNSGKITLLHSGIVYPEERDPTALMAGLALLRDQDPGRYAMLRVRFRAPVHDRLLHDLAARHGVSNVIEVLPPTGYLSAIVEMLRADVLLVLQAGNCNDQIPAKLYESLRASRPILALTEPAGDTSASLSGQALAAVVPIGDAPAIALVLRSLLERLESLAGLEAIVPERYDRRNRARELALVLGGNQNQR